MNIPLILREAA